MQWRYKAVEPLGECKSDLEICDLLFNEIKALYEKEGGENPECITNVKWDYYVDGKIDFRAVAWAINGYNVADKKLLPSFTELKADGSTSCALWIATGYYANNDDPLDPSIQACAKRGTEDPSGLGLYPD